MQRPWPRAPAVRHDFAERSTVVEMRKLFERQTEKPRPLRRQRQPAKKGQRLRRDGGVGSRGRAVCTWCVEQRTPPYRRTCDVRSNAAAPAARRLQSWVRFLLQLVHTLPAHNALTSVDARFVLPVCACLRCAWHFNGARVRAQLRVLCARKGSFAKPCEKSPAAAARGKCAARALLATLVRPGALYSLQWVCARDPSHYSSSLSSSSSSSTSSKACAASAASTPACAAKSAAAASPRRGANLPLI